MVETVYLDGPLATPNTQDTNHGHYWVGGEQGNNGKWSLRVGPSYPDIIWDFFSRNSRDGTEPEGFPVITLIGDNPMTVAINTTKNRTVEVVDPNAPIETCEQATTSPNTHISAGRAYYAGGYFTTGGDDTLGALSGTYTWVKETSEGFFEAGACN